MKEQTQPTAFYFAIGERGDFIPCSKEQWEQEWLVWYNRSFSKFKKQQQQEQQ